MDSSHVATERRILDAAMKTIAARKISGTRLREVARRAGMSQGNLHHYFPSKDDLFIALLDEMLVSFVAEREAGLENSSMSPREKLWRFFDQMLGIMTRRRHRLHVFYDFWVQGTVDPVIRKKMATMYARWREDVEQVVREGVKRGEFKAQRSSSVPALMVSLMEGAALQYLIDEQVFDPAGYFAVAKECVEAML